MPQVVVKKFQTGLSNQYGEVEFVEKEENGKRIYEMHLGCCFGLEIKEVSKAFFDQAEAEFNVKSAIKGVGSFNCPKCYSLNVRCVEHASGLYYPSYQCLDCGFAASGPEWVTLQSEVVNKSKKGGQ